jgi:hypothetical protein
MMPARRTKDLFVIHTKSKDSHQRLHEGLSEAFDKAGLSVWQYSDWNWTEPDRTQRDWRFDEDAVELMSEVDTEVLGVEPPRRVQGNVDRARLHRLIADTPAVLIFDLPERDITPGVREEVDIVDRVFGQLFPSGHFDLVRFGAEGHLADRYPLHCGAVLELDVSGGVQQETVDQLALFSLRVLVRKDMVSRLWLGEPSGKAIEALGDWVSRTARLIASCEPATRGVAELLEEALSWIVCLARKFGAESVWKQLPIVANWVESRFDGACRHTDLREEGLLSLISVLRSLGSRDTEMLNEIHRKPLYRESKGVQAVSWMAVVKSSLGLGAAQGRSALEPLIETATSGAVPDYMFGALLEGIGRLAEKEGPPVRRRAVEFVRNLVERGSLDASAVGACLSAFGRVAERSDATWLRAVLVQDRPEPVRLKALLALMRIIGSEAEDLVLDFIKVAGPAARRTIGSASWRIDKDPVYDALLELDAHDEKMRGVVLYALIRAGNGRAWADAMQDLGSESQYLRDLAAASAPQIVNRYQLSDTQVEQLATSLARLLDYEAGHARVPEVARFGAVVALVRLSQQQHVPCADDLLRDCLTQGSTKRARALLVNGGLGLAEWPGTREARLLLLHPSPDVRGGMAFVAGHQKRHEMAQELRMLQKDPSDVTAFYSDRAMQDIGTTVEESASIALARISGDLPEVETTAW